MIFTSGFFLFHEDILSHPIASPAYGKLSFHGNRTVTRMNIAFSSLLSVSFTGYCNTSTNPAPDTSSTSYGAFVPDPVM